MITNISNVHSCSLFLPAHCYKYTNALPARLKKSILILLISHFVTTNFSVNIHLIIFSNQTSDKGHHLPPENLPAFDREFVHAFLSNSERQSHILTKNAILNICFLHVQSWSVYQFLPKHLLIYFYINPCRNNFPYHQTSKHSVFSSYLI